MIVDSEESGRTTREDIYAAGDAVRGADLVVTALAAARKAAVTMHQRLMELKTTRASHGTA